MDNSRTQLRVELREADPQIVKRSLRIVQTILELHLALDHLADLAVDLAQLLDHHLLEELLAQHGDRHDRTRALAGLGGGLVCTVVALVAHAISIPAAQLRVKPMMRNISTESSDNIAFGLDRSSHSEKSLGGC